MTVDPLFSRSDAVPFGRMPGFSKLYAAYCEAFDMLAPYFAADYRSSAGLRERADAAAALPRDRDTLATVLLAQNGQWDADEACVSQIERLRRPDAVAVVTGQQVGLLGGPLYTVYKTVTAIRLARRMEAEQGRPVVPVFWLEGEDHDFDEVRAIPLLRGNEPVVVRYGAADSPISGNLGPVGRLGLTDDIERVFAELEEILPATEYRDTVLDLARKAYRPGVTLRDAFARFMRSVFRGTGLVFISPDHPRLKALAAPLFQREIDEFETSAARLDTVSRALEAQFHAQVHARPLNLFLLEDDGRFALEPVGSRFRLRGTERGYTREELHRLLAEEPGRFSPNVVLRPLLQDTLLPTAAYIAGPGEVAYFAQFKPIYEWSGIPMPVIYPRMSASLVEGKVRKVMDRHHVGAAELGEDLEVLFRKVVIDQMDVDMDEAFEEARTHVARAVARMREVASSVDVTLERAADASGAQLLKEIDQFQNRVVKAEKRNQETVRGQLEKAQQNFYPGGKLQERSLSALQLMAKYGPSFPRRLVEDAPQNTAMHWVLDL